MNIIYHILRILAKSSSNNFKEKVNLSNLRSFILDFMEDTEHVKYLTIFIHDVNAIIVLTPRIYEIGKRLTLYSMTTLKRDELYKKIQTELQNKEIPSTMRINKYKGKSNFYIRIENIYDEGLVKKIVSTIIKNVYELNEESYFDLEVATSKIMVYKETPSDSLVNSVK